MCAFSKGPADQRQLLTSFVRAGLLDGDYCVVAIDDFSADGLLTEIDGDLATSSGELHVVPGGSNLHLSNATVAEALEAWTSIVERARRAGFGFIRLGGEASWWLSHDGGVDMTALLEYEDTLSAWSAAVPDVAMLCCYDMGLFPSGVVADLVGCHREVVVDGQWLELPDDINR